MSKNYNSDIPQDWDVDAVLATEGKSKTQRQIDQLTDQYTSRGPFSYDPAADAGYQSYVNMMKANGEAAMRDTMAKAASLTGGYGNSYAVAAAQGAYNDYLREADAAQGEFYDRALAKYNAEGNELLNRLSLLQGQEDAAYQREWNENERNYQREQAEYEKAWNEAVLKEQYGDPSSLFALGVSEESYDTKFEAKKLAEYEGKPISEHSLSYVPPAMSSPFDDITQRDIIFDDETGEGYTAQEIAALLKKEGFTDNDITDYLKNIMNEYMKLQK